MKTLLLSVNSKYVHSSLAVWYLKASAKEYTDTIKILESTIKENKIELIDKICAENADIIAISCYIFNINYVKSILPEIRSRNPKAIIVLGGPEVSYNCKQVFDENSEVDYILSGEGETPFYEFVKAVDRGLPIEEVKGANSREFSSVPHITDEEPVSPYTEEYLKALKGRIAYIETTRGCPYSCAYCLSGRLCKVKFFSMDRVKNDIIKLSHSGTQTIKFVDRTFNCRPKRAKEIIDFIINNEEVNHDVCFHFEMAGDIITQGIIDSLARAKKGLFQIEVGVQSFNEKTLEAVNRKTDISKIERNMNAIISNNNCHVHMDLIAGLPEEDIDSFEFSFNRLFKLRPHMLQLGFLKLLHGTPLEDRNIGEFSKTSPYEIIENKWLSKEDLQVLKYTEDAVDRLYNSGRFRILLEKILEKHDNPYRLFRDFGSYSKTTYGTKMDDYCKVVLEYFSNIYKEDNIKDIMKEQWLRINSSGKLPVCLQEESMGALLKELDREPETKRKKGVKRAAAFIKSENCIIWVDYEDKDPVTSEYKVQRKYLQ